MLESVHCREWYCAVVHPSTTGATLTHLTTLLQTTLSSLLPPCHSFYVHTSLLSFLGATSVSFVFPL